MRVCDFLHHVSGNFIVNIYDDNKTYRKGSLDYIKMGYLNDKTYADGKFVGFKCTLWEMKVEDWSIKNNNINVKLFTK